MNFAVLQAVAQAPTDVIRKILMGKVLVVLTLALFGVIHMPQNVNNNLLQFSYGLLHAPFGFPFGSYTTPDAKKKINKKVTKLKISII